MTTVIAQWLDALGVPRQFKGYHYLIDAIRLVVYDLRLLHTVTKDLISFHRTQAQHVA